MRSSRMFGLFLTFVLPLCLASLGHGRSGLQEAAQAGAKSITQATSTSEAATSAGKPSTDVRAGTKIRAQLESTVDARTAKPGDRVEARVTKDVKQSGRVVVHKGDRLVGRITDVRSGTSAGSHMAVAFDQLVSGDSASHLNAVLTSVVSGSSGGSAQGEEMMTSEPMPALGPSRGAGSRSGATGGLGGTLSSTVNAAGSAVGSAANSVGTTANTTVDSATRATLSNGASAMRVTPISAIRIHSESDAAQSARLNSVLSTPHGDLRLESGTRLEFRVAGQAEAGGGTR